MVREYIWYESETENGSKVEIKEWTTPGTAWTFGTRHTVIFVEMNEKDFDLISSLNLPNWNHDFTGRGLVLETGKLDWAITKQKIETLKIKTPWKRKPKLISDTIKVQASYSK